MYASSRRFNHSACQHTTADSSLSSWHTRQSTTPSCHTVYIRNRDTENAHIRGRFVNHCCNSSVRQLAVPPAVGKAPPTMYSTPHRGSINAQWYPFLFPLRTSKTKPLNRKSAASFQVYEQGSRTGQPSALNAMTRRSKYT